MSRATTSPRFAVILWLLFCIVVFAIVTVGSFFWLPASERYDIIEQYLFSSTGDDTTTVYLGVILPRSGPYQEVEQLTTDWVGSVNWDDEASVGVVKLVGPVSGQASQEASIRYEVTLYQGRAQWEGEITEAQLEPQYNIESGHPTILEAASKIAKGTSRQDAFNIFQFTSESLTRPMEERQFIDASALQAYLTGVGFCGEFANLMVALCRASGIPAQTIIGILLPELLPYSTAGVRALNHPGESHAWVEFYSERGWEMADPSCHLSFPHECMFGRNVGRHLSYGEVKELSDTYAAMRRWVEERGSLVGTRFSSLKFVAAADSDDVLITPRVTMKKGWDGRWFNMLVSWMVTMIVLHRLNLKKVRENYPI